MIGSRSFTDYVSDRFDTDIYCAVCDYVRDSEENDYQALELRTYKVHQIGSVELSDTNVIMAYAYNKPGMMIGFDIQVNADFVVNEGDHRYAEQSDGKVVPPGRILRDIGDIEDVERNQEEEHDLNDEQGVARQARLIDSVLVEPEKDGQEAIRKEAEKSCKTLCACYVLLEFIVENYDWNSAEPALQ